MDDSKDTQYRKTFWVRFLWLFLPIFIVTVIVIFGFCYLTIYNRFQGSVDIAHHALGVEEQILADKLLAAGGDGRYLRDEMLLVLSGKNLLITHTEIDSQLRNKLLTQFVIFAKFHPTYDQLRFIDQNGQEIIRIDHRNGKLSVIPESKLQNKKHRYYFKRSLVLDQNNIYYSPLDLNVENKKIEQPLRPMIRIGVPVITKEGDKIGVILLNYNAQELLEQFKLARLFTPGQWFIVNERGHFLLSNDPQLNWGNMFKQRQQFTLGYLFPGFSRQLRAQAKQPIVSTRGVFFLRELSSDKPTFKNSDLTLRFVWYMPWSKLIPASVYYFITLGIVIIALSAVLAQYFSRLYIKQIIYAKELEFYSRIDPVTHVLTRREFFLQGNHEFERTQRRQTPYSILMLDIDFFKKVNDTFGHQYGDMALEKLGATLKSTLRQTDLIGRYGGEEFVVLLPETPVHLAREIAEKIREEVSLILIETEKDFLSFHVSIGVSQWSDEDQSLSETLNRADKKLYEAKQNGRDQVRCESVDD